MVTKKDVIAKLRELMRENATARKNAQKSGDKLRHNKQAARARAAELVKALMEPQRPPEVTRDAPATPKWASQFLGKHFAVPSIIHTGNGSAKRSGLRSPAKAIAAGSAHLLNKSGEGAMRYATVRGDDANDSLVVVDKTLKALQELHDEVYLSHMILSAKGNAEYRQNPMRALKSTRVWKRWMKETEPLRKAMTSTGSGVGDEWVPTGFSQDFIDAVYLGSPVARLFPVIAMPTQPFDIPGAGARPVAYSPSEGSAPSAASAVATLKRTLTAQQFKAYDTYTDEVEEDSLVAVVPFIRSELIAALGEGIETSVINGDSAGTHGDNDIDAGAADHPAITNWIGLRHTAIDQSYTAAIGQPATFTKDLLMSIRAELGKGYVEDPSKHAWITGSQGYVSNILDISEISTVEKFGQSAVIRTGAIDNILGSPIYLSKMFPENLHDTGVNVSGQANDTTGILCVHTGAAFTGFRRQATLEADKVITTGVNTIVASTRFAFQWRFAPASHAVVGYGINVRTAATA